MEFSINITAVLVAAIVSFTIGFVWYTVLFAKLWMKEMGYSSDMRPNRNSMLKGISFMLVSNLLFVWVLAWTMAGWQFIPNAREMGSTDNGINSAIFLWLGFFVPVHVWRIVWEKSSWKLFAINASHHLVTLMITALIIAHWQ
jgi:multisubunit Na+/H+ antiporter MnhB subunit